jgi:LPXTG-motif cell wall-anchored protein
MTPIDVGLSFAQSSAADSGHINAPLTVTGGGGGGSLSDLLLPKTATTQTWIVYAFLAIVAGFALLYLVAKLKNRP